MAIIYEKIHFWSFISWLAWKGGAITCPKYTTEFPNLCRPQILNLVLRSITYHYIISLYHIISYHHILLLFAGRGKCLFSQQSVSPLQFLLPCCSDLSSGWYYYLVIIIAFLSWPLNKQPNKQLLIIAVQLNDNSRLVTLTINLFLISRLAR